MPWRSGAGVTREIVRVPAEGESFDWRLSLATLQTSGPFSAYSGYHRAIALVDGRGFRLSVAGAAARELTVRGDHALFPGAAQTWCEILDGPCTDLSLMVRASGKIHTVTRIAVTAEHRISVCGGRIQVIFVLAGAIECRATESLVDAAKLRGRPYTLNVNDTLLIHGRGNAWSMRPAAGENAEALLITFSSSDPERQNDLLRDGAPITQGNCSGTAA
jgi:environmental stress-induced protein Ves